MQVIEKFEVHPEVRRQCEFPDYQTAKTLRFKFLKVIGLVQYDVVLGRGMWTFFYHCLIESFLFNLLQEVESVFDVMELEDDERTKLLKMEDSQMAVRFYCKTSSQFSFNGSRGNHMTCYVEPVTTFMALNLIPLCLIAITCVLNEASQF